jgi:hypothetical protein
MVDIIYHKIILQHLAIVKVVFTTIDIIVFFTELFFL